MTGQERYSPLTKDRQIQPGQVVIAGRGEGYIPAEKLEETTGLRRDQEYVVETVDGPRTITIREQSGERVGVSDISLFGTRIKQ